MKETKFRTLKNPDTGKQREARVIQRGRKIGSVIVVSIMFAMSFAVCFSMSAEALEFVEPMTMPWTTAFEPMDSAWDSTGNHCVIIGNDTSGIQSSAWYYNAGANTTVPILEGSDPTMTPINIVENANTSIQYGTIQAALDAASSGNILNVWAGTYNENIVIGKALTLTGNGSANTIINGGGSGNAVTIKASGVKFNGFNVTGGASAGILLYTVQNCTIENDTVVGNGDGIYLKGSSNNIIKNNNVKNNALGLRTANSTATKSLVGLTNSGGAADSGAMFKMTPSGLNYSIMHDFKAGYIDGRYPYYTQFIKDIYNVNILYGTTANGGTYDYGTVFRINTDGSAHTVLHKFKGGATDGSYPYGGLVQDGTALYGMTCQGGASNMGTLFRINTDGSDFTLLHSFAGGATDGSNPYGSLILDGAALFGMTYQGGASSMGTIFSINIDGSSFTMLHSFNGTKFDGSYPYASLTRDGITLYGMTYRGGASNMGTMFKIDTSGLGFTLLHSFNGTATDGSYPYGSLTWDGTVLYGMTYQGGASGVGTIISIKTDGSSFTLLHSFNGTAFDGSYPYGSLNQDGAALYGMTLNGGASGMGTIFKIDTSGLGFTLLHSFVGGATDGSYPYGTLMQNGLTLYGLTNNGGVSSLGTTFRINTDGTSFTLLHSFLSTATDCTNPRGHVIQDGTTLYGMASNGGNYSMGAIYKINTDGTGFAFMHEFAGGATDGSYPYGSLIQDGAALYGMTYQGGASNQGIIFSINTDGSSFTMLHSFNGTKFDGSYPYASLTRDGITLYGMTYRGGASDIGTLFKINTNGSSFTLLHSFNGTAFDGSYPYGSLVQDGAALYGMTYQGGVSGLGTIFSFTKASSSFTLLHSFNGTAFDGSYPYGSLTRDGAVLYGMTYRGGASDLGTIIKINTDGSGFALLRSFASGGGNYPYGSLVQDGIIMYGMTYQGGASGMGTAFRFNKDTTAFTVLHDFQGYPNDASYPYMGDISLILNPALTSSGNLIYHNNFIANTQQAQDDTIPPPSNSWDNGLPDGGNYWSDYAGVDGNSDGIGNTTYAIPGGAGAVDNYPWMLQDGWVMPYTIFKSVAWDNVHQRFWICGDYSADAQSSFYYVPVSAPSTMVPISTPAISFSALAVDELGNLLVGGNNLQYIYYFETSTDNGYEIAENGTGDMWGWNITGITFNPYDNRFYFVGNVKNTDTGVAFFTESLPLNATGKKCFIDNSDFMNFPGIGGLRSISWNPVRNYSLAVGDGVYRLNPYTGTDQKLSWSTIEGPEAGKSYYDISWDFNGSNEAGIVGANGLFGNYWRYYHTNLTLIDGYTDTVMGTKYRTCAMKPPSSPKWLFIPYNSGGWRVNILEKDEGGTVSFNSDFPHAFTVSVWKQSDILQTPQLNTQVDADSTYTFFIEGNYTVGGVDHWNDLIINITAWFDENHIGDASNPEPNWNTKENRTRQFNITYEPGGPPTLIYPNATAGIQEFAIPSFWSDPTPYGSDGYTHRVLINVTFGKQTWAADGAGFFQGAATDGETWNKVKALNDPGSWDMQVYMYDRFASATFNLTYEEFGIKEFASISSSGNPTGSAPPGTVAYHLSNPSNIRYSSNTPYFVNISIPDLHQNGDPLNPKFIPATSLQVQNMHSLAVGSSNISSQTQFLGANLTLCVWGLSGSPGTPIAAPNNGTESAGPMYSDYSAAIVSQSFEFTVIEWWIDVPAGISQGVYIGTITLTITDTI